MSNSRLSLLYLVILSREKRKKGRERQRKREGEEKGKEGQKEKGKKRKYITFYRHSSISILSFIYKILLLI